MAKTKRDGGRGSEAGEDSGSEEPAIVAAPPAIAEPQRSDVPPAIEAPGSDDAPPAIEAPGSRDDRSVAPFVAHGSEPSDESARPADTSSSQGSDLAPAKIEANTPGDAPKPAAWADPIARFERRWTDLEAKLITVVLLGEVLVLVAWVFLSGLSSPISSGNAAGMVFRAVAGGVVLGLGARFATRRMERSQPSSSGLPTDGATSTKSTLIILGAAALGIALAPTWRRVGVDYFDNVKGWLQEGSTLTLMGGLRGLATRLTLWLALLGASLATAAGKHIHIDIIFRFLPAKVRRPVAIVNFLAAAVVCVAAAWGFFDHVAIESYGSRADDAAGSKIGGAVHQVGQHLFFTRKQIGLDLRSLPHVLKGERYDTWMSARQWNAWLADGAFEPRFTPEQAKTLVVPESGPAHPPLVLSPDGEVTRGVLVADLSLVFPFGFLVLALRFLLRATLTLSGHIPVDPDAAHKEEFGEPKRVTDPDDEIDPSDTAKGGA